MPFFSRRIGIGSGNRQVPIVGGGRVSGRLGGLGVGFLAVQTEAVDIDPEVVDVARKWFGLGPDLRVHVADARRYLMETDARYDYVVLDGIKPGDKVITTGVQMLADGVPVGVPMDGPDHRLPIERLEAAHAFRASQLLPLARELHCRRVIVPSCWWTISWTKAQPWRP